MPPNISIASSLQDNLPLWQDKDTEILGICYDEEGIQIITEGQQDGREECPLQDNKFCAEDLINIIEKLES